MSKGSGPRQPSILRPLRSAARQHNGWGIKTIDMQRDRGQSDGRAVYGTYRWQKLVAQLKKKRGERCELCGAAATRLEAHHVIELKDGGDPWSEANISLACRPCHASLTAKAKRVRSWSSTRDELMKLIDDDVEQQRGGRPRWEGGGSTAGPRSP
jgi:5-methylcytosine-specific restriction endonuclease McrA